MMKDLILLNKKLINHTMQQWALQKNFILPKIKKLFFNKGQSALKRKRIIKKYSIIQQFKRSRKACNQKGIMFNLEIFILKLQSLAKQLINQRRSRFITYISFLRCQHLRILRYKWMISNWKERKKWMHICKMFLIKLLKSTLN